MSQETILQKICHIIESVTQTPIESPNENTRFENIDGWDSLSHVMIIGEVEKNYSARFGLADLHKIKNLGDLVSLVERHLSAKST